MRSKTYRVPGIHEHAIEISALRLVLQVLLNLAAWSGSDDLDAAETRYQAASSPSRLCGSRFAPSALS